MAGEQVYQPQVSVQGGGHVVPQMRPSPVGEAVEQLGDQVLRKYQADSATWAGDQVADFRLKSIQQLDQAKQDQPAGDPGNFTERYLGQFDKDAATLVGSSQGNPVGRRMIESGVAGLRRELAAHTLEWEASQRVAYQTDSLQQNLDKQLPLVRAHPEIADQVGATLMDQVNSIRTDPAERLTFARKMDNALTQEAAMGMADANPLAVYQQLKEGANPTDARLARLINPAARAAVLEYATGKAVDGLADGIANQYRDGGPQAGQKAYAAIDALKLPDDLKDKLRAGVRARRGELMQQAQEANGSTLLAVHEAIASGDPAPQTRGQVWSLYNKNALSPEQTGSYLGELDRLALEQAKKYGDLAAIGRAYQTATPLDPKDTEVKKGASNWFGAVAKQNNLAPGSQPWVNLAGDFANKTGVIPDQVGDWARATLVGGQDPASVMSSVDTIQRMKSASPRGFAYLDDDNKLGAMADSIASLTQAGVPSQQAIDMARQNSARAAGDRKVLDQQWAAAKPFGKADIGLDSVLTSQIKSDNRLVAEKHWWRSNELPPRPPAMLDDYYTLTRNYFDQNGGKLDQAEASAARDIGNAWGVTRMNGEPEYSRWAPERVFRAPDGSPGLTAEDIRSDLTLTVEKHAPPALEPAPEGLKTPATIKNLFERPVLNNPDGSYSTTSSMSIGTPKGEVLIPTVIDGKRLSDADAIKHYEQTDEHLGVFDTPAHADAYAQKLHEAQQQFVESDSSETFRRWDPATRELVAFTPDPDKLKLAETRDTSLTGGRRWGMVYESEPGVHEVLFGRDGRPLSYDLPVTVESYGAQHDAQVKRAVDAALARKKELEKQEAEAQRARMEDWATHSLFTPN